MFDEIIIRQDKNLRGRSEQEIIDLMMKGVQMHDAKKKVTVMPKESEAIEFALRNAKKGSFITICSDVVPDALGQIMKYKEEEDHFMIQKEDIPTPVIL
jgi:cyanophycin synthetase